MKLTKKQQQIAIVLLVIGLVAWWLVRNNWKIQRWTTNKATGSGLVNPDDVTIDQLDFDKPLYKGVVGAIQEVIYLQDALVYTFGQDLGNTGQKNDGVDGIFGPKTEAGLEAVTGKKRITLRELPLLATTQETEQTMTPNYTMN